MRIRRMNHLERLYGLFHRVTADNKFDIAIWNCGTWDIQMPGVKDVHL
jgi:hypothetical protein